MVGVSTLAVAKNPCSTCPYRKDTPPGVWSADEYEKLRLYDEPEFDPDYPEAMRLPEFAAFLCHHSLTQPGDTLCRGWLTVHSDSVAVRLTVAKGAVTWDQVDAPVTVELYASGNEAADAGEVAIEAPSWAAVRAAQRLLAKRERAGRG
jgi:Family of unknown function (DUF6283)